MNELQPTHAVPNNMIQLVRIERAPPTGKTSFSSPKTMMGTNQTIVLTVQAVKVTSPCRFRKNLAGKATFRNRVWRHCSLKPGSTTRPQRREVAAVTVVQ